MTKFWICVISLVKRTTKFPAENCSIFPNEKVWIFRKASSRMSALTPWAVSYTHLRAHETDSYLVCRLLLEKKKENKKKQKQQHDNNYTK